MNCEYYDKIVDYLDNNLNDQEKEKFESYLAKNDEFKHIVSDFRFQSELIKELPKVETSSNFIINLNNRIDKYHSNNKYFWSKVFETNRIKYIPLLGALSLFVIISFSLFKVSNYSLSYFYVDENKFDNSIAINDVDSLKNQYEDAPVLLIGNKK